MTCHLDNAFCGLHGCANPCPNCGPQVDDDAIQDATSEFLVGAGIVSTLILAVAIAVGGAS